MKLFNAALVASGLVVGISGSAVAQDAAKGQSSFNTCKACHALDHNVVGPQLAGVVGRKAGSVAGFEYSPLLKAAGEAGLVWNEAELVDYLKGPTQYLQAYVKGKGKEASGSSKMSFQVSGENQRKNIVAYLKEQK